MYGSEDTILFQPERNRYTQKENIFRNIYVYVQYGDSSIWELIEFGLDRYLGFA